MKLHKINVFLEHLYNHCLDKIRENPVSTKSAIINPRENVPEKNPAKINPNKEIWAINENFPKKWLGSFLTIYWPLISCTRSEKKNEPNFRYN